MYLSGILAVFFCDFGGCNSCKSMYELENKVGVSELTLLFICTIILVALVMMKVALFCFFF